MVATVAEVAVTSTSAPVCGAASNRALRRRIGLSKKRRQRAAAQTTTGGGDEHIDAVVVAEGDTDDVGRQHVHQVDAVGDGADEYEWPPRQHRVEHRVFTDTRRITSRVSDTATNSFAAPSCSRRSVAATMTKLVHRRPSTRASGTKVVR